MPCSGSTPGSNNLRLFPPSGRNLQSWNPPRIFLPQKFFPNSLTCLGKYCTLPQVLFVRQIPPFPQEGECMNVSNLFRALLTLTCITTVLNGCGGNGPTTPPIYAGDFTGGEVVLGSDRGGGPMIDIGSTTVQGSDGRFGTTVTLNIPAKVPIVGGIIGSISTDGVVTATVELTDGGTLSIGGGPLHWQDGR